MSTVRTRPLLIIAFSLPLLLGGCLSFGGKTPETLLSLTADAAVPIGETVSSANAKSISITVPAVPQSLATARVPVQANNTSIAYLKDAAWVEPPQRLFARVLADTVSARTGRVVLSTAQSFSDPGARMSGELRNFGVDATTSEAVVTFDAALIRNGGQAVEKRRFEARVPVTEIAAAPVGVALNQGANRVAGEVADWVGR